MIKTYSIITAVLIAAAFPVASYAATRDAGVNQRQHNQQQRMQQGWRSGDLTRNESRNLQGQARDIRREEQRYRSDGNFTRAERADVRHDLNNLSRDIYRERHDGQQRFDDRRFGYQRPGDRYFGSRDIDRMQQMERERIQRGIRSGELTRSEASRLIAEQRMVAQEERVYRSDGKLTKDERRDLWQDLNAARGHIYNETHDAQDRN